MIIGQYLITRSTQRRGQEEPADGEDPSDGPSTHPSQASDVPSRSRNAMSCRLSNSAMPRMHKKDRRQPRDKLHPVRRQADDAADELWDVMSRELERANSPRSSARSSRRPRPSLFGRPVERCWSPGLRTGRLVPFQGTRRRRPAPTAPSPSQYHLLPGTRRCRARAAGRWRRRTPPAAP